MMNKKYVFTSFFILTLIFISVLFFKVISPFIFDIVFAVLLVHFFSPIREWFARKLNDKLTGFATLASIVFLLVIPIFVIGWMVSIEIAEVYKDSIENWPMLQQKVLNNEYLKNPSSIPIIGNEISKQSIDDFIQYIGQIITNLAKYSFVFLKSFLLNLTTTIAHFLFTLLLTFYLLVDHKKVKDFVQHIVPLDRENIEEIYFELKKTSDATIKGTFLIGVIEGTFGAILLAIVGINSVIFWGVIMLILSMIPLIGITIVLIPFAIFLLLTGNIWESLFVLVVGISGVTFTQNILKPKLVGNASGLHQGVILISGMGGIALFGVIGFIIGPMIATLFFVVWRQFGLKYES